jgi:3-hydroxyacyl-CoA dehydrogenase
MSSTTDSVLTPEAQNGHAAAAATSASGTPDALSKRHVQKVAILGSGVMGSRIACHFANIGCDVVLLDIVPFDLAEEDKDKPAARNRLVNEALKATLKSRPASLYDKGFAKRIRTGNFDDDLALVAEADWILEAVIENLEIKQQLFEKVEAHRKPGSIISSNTSGIPIAKMLDGRSEDFRKHFLGTHFFNPPRYLRLLEIIPTPDTDPEVTDFCMAFGSLQLGKTTVHCKDTPAFIANRVGVFSMMTIIGLMQEMDMSVEEVDALTGPISGRPKSATFRTADVVGLDTFIKVADNLYADCPEDEARETFKIPDFIRRMADNKWLGDKTGQGFYKKTKDENGKRQILALKLSTMEYQPKAKPRFDAVKAAKPVDDLRKRLRVLHGAEDKAGDFFRQASYRISQYVSKRIPEIADALYQLDDALRAGFGWELGPFETWDALGVKDTVAAMKDGGYAPAAWVDDMLAAGAESFYKSENGRRLYWDTTAKAYKPVPGTQSFIVLDNYRDRKPVWSNSGATLHDIGDGVLCLEFHTKMNAMGAEIIQGINKAVDTAENGYKGLVIGNDAANFSAGANIMMMLMLAFEQEWDELNLAIRTFQNTVARARFSAVPVVVAPHGLTLGGGCELTMHGDAAVVAAETYIGLVEVGAGLIPGGGGTKEFALRAADAYREGDVELNVLQERLLTIAQAKVATSAEEAYGLGILRRGTDRVVINQDRLLAEAKAEVLALDREGYVQPSPRQDVRVLGQTALGSFYVAIDSMMRAKYISEHDALIARKLAYVITGGDLSQPSQVSEQYLLDLERETFLSLLGEKKTLERMQHILQTGKPLRN